MVYFFMAPIILIIMKTIPLGGKRGGEAIIDDIDYEWLNQWRWKHAIDGYAKRNFRVNGKSVTIKMHRLIMFGESILTTPDERWVDHINRNRLDYRRENLRLCDNSLNTMNSKISTKNTSGYKGVIEYDIGRWEAQFNSKLCNKRIGYFDTPEKAAMAYNSIVFSLFHDYSLLNIISGVLKEDSIIMPEKMFRKISIRRFKTRAPGEYRGVQKTNMGWVASFEYRINKIRHLKWSGTFDTPEKAATAYNSMCFSFFHDYDMLNKIPNLTLEQSIIMPEKLPRKKYTHSILPTETILGDILS